MFRKSLWAREQLARMALNEISTVDLAKELGCSKSYVSQIFNGRKPAKRGTRNNVPIDLEKIQSTISMMIEKKQKGG